MKKRNCLTLLLLLIGLASCGGKVTSSSELHSLMDALKRDYSNVTYQEDVEMKIQENAESHEIKFTTIETIDGDTYKHLYRMGNETSIIYVEKKQEGVKLYTYEPDNKYYYRMISHDQWNHAKDEEGNLLFAEDYSYMRNPNDFEIEEDSFVKKEEEYICKESDRDRVGRAMIPGIYEEAIFTQILFSLQDGFVKEIDFSFSVEIENYGMEVHYHLTYEEIGSTVVVLPRAEEYGWSQLYINPNYAVNLSQEEKETLRQVLLENYESYQCRYHFYNAQETMHQYENLKYENGKYDIYQESYREEGNYYDSYFLEEKENRVYRYYLNEQKEVAQEELKESQISSYTPYGGVPSSFGFSSEYFGIYQGTYVFKPYYLRALNEGIGASDRRIESIEIKLNSKKEIDSIQIVSSHQEEQFIERYTYSNLHRTRVHLPEIGSNGIRLATEEEIAFFQQAVAEEVRNVTMFDNVFSTLFLKDQNIVQGIGVEEEGGIVSQTFKEENGKYYVSNEFGATAEIPYHTQGENYGYDYYVPVIDFSAIDTSQMIYHSFEKTYSIDFSFVDLSRFIFYYSLDFDYDFTRILFSFDMDGHLRSIQFCYLSDGVENSEFGLHFSNYGTTKLVN